MLYDVGEPWSSVVKHKIFGGYWAHDCIKMVICGCIKHILDVGNTLLVNIPILKTRDKQMKVLIQL